MSKIKFHCEFCDLYFDNEAECLEHEITHSTVIACRKIKGEKIIDCEVKIIRYSACISMILLWQAGQRKVSYEFQLDNEEGKKLAEVLS